MSTLIPDGHLYVDGMLIEECAGVERVRPGNGGGPGDGGKAPPGGGGRDAGRHFHGEKRSDDTSVSITGPGARPFRTGLGKKARLCHMGHLSGENRHGLVVNAMVTPAAGTGERLARCAP